MSKCDFSLKGKNVIITGASSGIGRECAIQCSKYGASIILIGRNERKLEEVYKMLEGANHSIIAIDLSDVDSIKSRLEKHLIQENGIHGMIYSAGIQRTLPLNQMKAEKYRVMFDVNLFAALEITRNMTKKKYLTPEGSSIIFISSIIGLVGRAGLSGYSATKGALIATTKSLAVELAKKKVRVNCISPGLIMSPMMQNFMHNLTDEQIKERTKNYLLGLGTELDIAGTSIFLLSDAARWITGQNIIVDGGYCAQ